MRINFRSIFMLLYPSPKIIANVKILYLHSAVFSSKMWLDLDHITSNHPENCTARLGEHSCFFTYHSKSFIISHSVQVHTYASQSEANTDCPGSEFSAEPWSNPISADWMTNVKGLDCMRLCYLTETCFAISIFNQKCYLKNEKCFSHLKPVRGSLFGGKLRKDFTE